MSIVRIDSLNLPITPGVWVLHLGVPWRLIGFSTPGVAILHRPHELTPKETPVAELQMLDMSGVNLDRLRPFSSYPEEKRVLALKRCTVIEGLLNRGLSVESLNSAARELQVSPQTLTRLINSFLASGGQQSALIPCAFKYGIRNRSLRPDVENLITEGISTRYYSTERKPIQAVIRFVEKECERRSLPMPSEDTIRERISRCPPRETMLHRYGRKAVRETFDPLNKRRPDAPHPLAKIEIDHTRLNLMAVTHDGKKRRPWITVALDDFSRVVLGFYISFDPPSWLSVALCLYRVVTPKEEWMREHGLTDPWPCFGRPMLLQADSAEEFHGSDMERVSLEWDFTVQARVLGLAQFGGRIERIMGRASYEMEFLPGKTFRSVVEKRDHDPEKLAVFNLLDLEQYLMIFFALVYNNSPHRGLRRRTPLNRWLEGEKAMGGLSRVQPAPDPSLLMNLLPSVDRTIQQDGVSWETITYFDPAIIPYIHTANPESTDGKFRFHYYPRDIRTLYTRLPGVHQWIQVRAKDLGMAPMSIWERDDANSADREAAKDERAEERARRGRAKLSEISDQKEAFALKEHRRQKRIQRSKTKGRTEVTQTETVPQANPAEFALESELRRLTTLECVPDPSLWENIPRIVGRNL